MRGSSMDTQLQPPTGCFDGAVHRFPVRVYFEDTDLTGIAYHANYLKWFERARSDIVRLLGIDQRASVEAGEGAYAVADLQIRYLSPARLDDVLTIRTVAQELRAASVRLLQQAWRDETLLSEMSVRVGFITPQGRPKRQPAEWREAFSRMQIDESVA